MTAANPKYPMLVNSKENRELFYNDDCDKYDYLTAVACGATSYYYAHLATTRQPPATHSR